MGARLLTPPPERQTTRLYSARRTCDRFPSGERRDAAELVRQTAAQLLGIKDGVMTQKVGRAGETVLHPRPICLHPSLRARSQRSRTRTAKASRESQERNQERGMDVADDRLPKQGPDEPSREIGCFSSV